MPCLWCCWQSSLAEVWGPNCPAAYRILASRVCVCVCVCVCLCVCVWERERVQLLSHVWVFATLLTIARQAPLSMGFSRQEGWSKLPFSPLWYLPNPGIETAPSALQWILYHWATVEAHLSSLTRDQTHISCIAQWILNHWTSRGVLW